MSPFAIFIFVVVFVIVLVIFLGLQSVSSDRRKLTVSRLAAIPGEARQIHIDDLDAIVRSEVLSGLPWMDRLLKHIDLSESLRVLLVQADSRWTVSRLLGYSAISMMAGFLLTYWRTHAVIAASLFGLLACFIPLVIVRQKRSMRLSKFEEHLPEALDMMVSSIRAGHGIQAAIGTVAKETAPPISSEFRICYDEHTFGLDFRTSLENLAVRVPLHDVQIVVTAILIQKESGGNLAEIVEKVAYIIRERFRLKREVNTRTAQGRLTGWILAFLPVVLGIAIFLVNPEYISKLWQKEAGIKLLYGAGMGTLIGGLIIRRIVNVRI